MNNMYLRSLGNRLGWSLFVHVLIALGLSFTVGVAMSIYDTSHVGAMLSFPGEQWIGRIVATIPLVFWAWVHRTELQILARS